MLSPCPDSVTRERSEAAPQSKQGGSALDSHKPVVSLLDGR
jgi:hypothetical protein